MKTKIGYFVPEFPGQTHMFFWREIEALKEYGIESDFVSSRLPPSKIISHVWAREAQQKTTYLFPPTHYLVGALTELLRSGPSGWLRCLKVALTAKGGSFSGRIRLLALAFLGAELAYLSRVRGWKHLHVHSCADSANIAMFAKLISGLPYSLTLHGPLEDYGPNQSQKWKHADFGIAVSKKLLHDIQHKLSGFLPDQLFFAAMGVNVDQIQRRTPYHPWQVGFPCRLFSCGRLNPVKGHHYLIEVIKILRHQGFDIYLQIAGEDEMGGNGYRRELGKLIQASGLSECVELLGAVSEDVIRAGLENAHVFVLASLNEGIPVAVMEAMAMAMPVVVTDVGGNSELINHGINALLVPAENPQKFADMLREVLVDEEFALKLSRQSRQTIITDFHHRKSAEILFQCLLKS
jgi:colanic acid/amylovoran biosynthesis glycosyltransferase